MVTTSTLELKMVVLAGVMEKVGNKKTGWDTDCAIWATRRRREKNKEQKKRIKVEIVSNGMCSWGQNWHQATMRHFQPVVFFKKCSLSHLQG
jgi:Na+/citrate or Na+/malate symporter